MWDHLRVVTKANELGDTGETVARNLRIIRNQKRLSLRKLQERLAGLDYSLTHTALANIETGKRRVEVDDLRAIADGLGVGMLALLVPPELDHEGIMDVVSEDGYPYRVQATLAQFVEHHSGGWPLALQRPLEEAAELEALAAYKLASDARLRLHSEPFRDIPDGDETTARMEAEVWAKDAQLALLKSRLEAEQREWESLRNIVGRRDQPEIRKRAARLWWRVGRQVRSAQQTLSTLATRYPEDRDLVAQIDSGTLAIVTDMAGTFEISSRVIDGHTVDCFADGVQLPTFFDDPSLQYSDEELRSGSFEHQAVDLD